MPRKQATNLTEIADAAVSYITRHGFKQTQMAGLARQIGVSAGTLYTYVDSKEALLGLAAAFLIHEESLPDMPLPVKAIPTATLATQFVELAEERGQWPVLKKAIAEADTRPTTLQAIGRELFQLVSTYHRSVLFLDRLANELEEFAPVHMDRVRGGFIGDVVTLLQTAGAPHDPFALGIIARAANEGISWSAMHRHHEGLAKQPTGDLTEDEICELASRSFAGALSAALPDTKKPAE